MPCMERGGVAIAGASGFDEGAVDVKHSACARPSGFPCSNCSHSAHPEYLAASHCVMMPSSSVCFVPLAVSRMASRAGSAEKRPHDLLHRGVEPLEMKNRDVAEKR